MRALQGIQIEDLNKSNNHCKEAIVMILLGVDCETAKQKLQEAKGFVRKALGQ